MKYHKGYLDAAHKLTTLYKKVVEVTVINCGFKLVCKEYGQHLLKKT